MFLRLSIEVDKAGDGLTADRAEDRVLVRSHSAIREPTVYAMHGISCGLISSDLPFPHVGVRLVEVSGLRCGQLGTVLDKVLPLSAEVDKRSEVWLPRFYVVRIHRHLFEVVGIFITETGKRMPELMDYDGLEGTVMSHGEVIGVVYAPSAIFISVDEYDDMFVRSAGEPVVKVFKMQSGQIAVAVEGVEVGVQCRVFPDTLRRF